MHSSRNPGSRLSGRQVVIYGLFWVLGGWLRSRIRHLLLMRDWGGYPRGDWRQAASFSFQSVQEQTPVNSPTDGDAFWRTLFSSTWSCPALHCLVWLTTTIDTHSALDAPLSSRTHSQFETFWRLGSVFNFLAFLVRGEYPSLLHRLLGIRFVYARPDLGRTLTFEDLNQQLLFGAILVSRR